VFIGRCPNYDEDQLHLKPPEQHGFTARLDCRYLLHVPEEVGHNPLLVIALHGYSSNPEVMLRLTVGLVGSQHVVASIQAPNQHYVTAGLPDGQSASGYNWGIRDHWESTVRLHHEMVLEVLAALRKRFQVGAGRCALVGFSQPVGLNYRFVATHPDQVAAVVGICGGVPRDWEESKYRPVTAAVLHISREDDEFYAPALASKFPERLRQHANDVEFHMLPGGHRFPSKADKIVRPWLDRVFANGAPKAFTPLST
jgi:predicted esterase